MRLTLTTPLAAMLFGLLSTGGIQAATSPEAIANVLSSCPVEERVGKCGNAVIDFANGLPRDAERNDDLLALASALADEAASPVATPVICLELQTAIRLAGQAAANAATRSEIAGIADALCAADIDYTATGSIGGNGGNDYVPPESLIEQEDPDDKGPPPPPPTDDGSDDGDDGDDGDDDGDIPNIE
jgi:hypothetical protein